MKQHALKGLLPWLLTLAATGAQAHVTLQEPSVVQGAYYRAAFKVGHGCEGSPTVKLVIDLPDEGLIGAKPMPKAGWQVSTETRALSQPYDSHGKRIGERVVRVTWTGGPLQDAHYDEFVLQLRVLSAPGTLWLPVEQVCEKGNNLWKDVPAAGQDARGLKFPAARLEVQTPRSEHKHH